MSELLDKIRSRGHWRVVVRPATFDEKRVTELSALLPILEKTFVQFKGWSFPHLEGSSNIDKGTDWVGQEIDWEPIVEIWRFYQTGQFVHYSGMMTDWNKHSSTFAGLPSQWLSEKTGDRKVLLDLKEVMLRFAEIFEFASRLSSTKAGDYQMHLEIELLGIEDYLFRVSPNDQVDFFREMANPTSRIPFTVDVPAFDLMCNTKELALKPAAELFQRFGWNPGIAVLRDIQYELLNPSPPKARWL